MLAYSVAGARYLGVTRRVTKRVTKSVTNVKKIEILEELVITFYGVEGLSYIMPKVIGWLENWVVRELGG